MKQGRLILYKISQNIQYEVFVENVFPHEITLLTQKKKTDTSLNTETLTTSEDYTGEIKTSKIS
jgi:hypothetical protein